MHSYIGGFYFFTLGSNGLINWQSQIIRDISEKALLCSYIVAITCSLGNASAEFWRYYILILSVLRKCPTWNGKVMLKIIEKNLEVGLLFSLQVF